MVNTSNFSKRLQKILDFYGVTATSFSEKIAFNRSTISHLLSGRNKPSLEFVMKVLQTYPEVDLYWLLNGTGSFPTASKKASLHGEQKNNPDKKQPKATNNRQDKNPANSLNTKAIERIVIFYEDGTFKQYNTSV